MEEHATPCQLVVSSEPPFLVLAASSGWLEMTGYTEEEVVHRPPSLFEGEGTCSSTAAAMRAALQVSSLGQAHPALPVCIAGGTPALVCMLGAGPLHRCVGAPAEGRACPEAASHRERRTASAASRG
eukprot:6341526-Prymnesium_polylepis.1